MGIQGNPRQNFSPVRALHRLLFQRAGFEGSERRIIAEEVIRIDIDPLESSGETQPDAAPVMTGGPFPACFPAVHPFPAVGKFIRNEEASPLLQEIFLRRKKLVACDERSASYSF